MYKSMIVAEADGSSVEHVFYDLPNGSTQIFPNIESNDGPERAAYLAWLAEGNEPEVVEL